MQKILPFLRQYFSFFIIGIIAAFSQAPIESIIASILGFSGLFYGLYRNKKHINTFYAGLFFGFGYFIFGLHWIGNALLTDISQFALFLPFAYLGLPCALALFYAVPLWLYDKIIGLLYQRKISHIVINFIVFIISLGLSDLLRGYIFTGFPWNLPVYATISWPILMQPSYLLGIYFYNFIWLGIAASFSLYFFASLKKKKYLACIHYSIFSLIAIYGYYHMNMHSAPAQKIDKNIIVRIIQPNILQKLKWSSQEASNNFSKLLLLSQKNLVPNARYVFVWPETALPFHPEHDFAAASKITDLLNNKHILITGKMRFVAKKTLGGYDYYNSIFKISHNGRIKSVFDKVHLVPFGEYLPLRFILDKIGFSQINFFKAGFSSGTSFKPFNLIDDIKASGLICYEAIFPQYSRKIAEYKTNMIINVTNDAWFGNSFGPYQHFVQTRFRAVENNIPIIRAANTGISGFIDPKGQIIKKLDFDKKGFLDIHLTDFLQ